MDDNTKPKATGPETIRLKLTREEFALGPKLAAFGVSQIPGLQHATPEQLSVVRVEWMARALSFLTRLPAQLFLQEIIAVDVVEQVPDRPTDRISRVKPPPPAPPTPSRLVGPNGQPLS